MEGYIGEIRMFGGNFAPLGWQFCQGQLRSIAEETALFSIVGTIYGGDGQVTFALPDLRGRVALGNFQGPGLSNYTLGEVIGTESVTLNSNTMPAHNHIATVTAGQGSEATATATLYGVNDAGGQQNPGGNLLGQESESAAKLYLNSGNPVSLKADSITINNLSASLPNVALSASGGNSAHSNLQPVLVLNFIICVEGIYPSRN